MTFNQKILNAYAPDSLLAKEYVETRDSKLLSMVIESALQEKSTRGFVSPTIFDYVIRGHLTEALIHPHPLIRARAELLYKTGVNK